MNITILTYLESEKAKTWDVVVDQAQRKWGADLRILAQPAGESA